jgi:hypothetical protein
MNNLNFKLKYIFTICILLTTSSAFAEDNLEGGINIRYRLVNKDTMETTAEPPQPVTYRLIHTKVKSSKR